MTRLLACFQYKGEADRFREQLEAWLEGFELRLAAEKTQCIEFGPGDRDVVEAPEANGAGSHGEVVDIISDDIYQLGYRGHDHSSERPAPGMDTAT